MIDNDTTRDEYVRNYNRGWAASERGSEGALERADGNGEHHSWYDGYMDSATGRAKWHTAHCPGEHGDDCYSPDKLTPPRELPAHRRA